MIEFTVIGEWSLGHNESLQAWGGECSLHKLVFTVKRLILLFLVSYNPTLWKLNSSFGALCHIYIGKSLFWRMSSFLGLKKKKNRYCRWFSIIHRHGLLESAIDILCQGIFSKRVCVSYLFHSVHHVTWSSQKKTTPVLILYKANWLIRTLLLRRVGMLKIQNQIKGLSLVA